MSHEEPLLPPEEQPYVVDQPAELRDEVSAIIIIGDRVIEWTVDCASLVQTFPEIYGRQPEELWINPVWYRRAVIAWGSGRKGRSVLELPMGRYEGWSSFQADADLIWQYSDGTIEELTGRCAALSSRSSSSNARFVGMCRGLGMPATVVESSPRFAPGRRW